MRLYALVEGKTESRFMSNVLGPHLAGLGVGVHPIQVRTSATQRGGLVSFEHVKRDMRDLVLRHRGKDARFTTMFDFYNLPKGFPAAAGSLDHPYSKVLRIETAMSKSFGDARIVPYLQLHEFEALLYVDLSVLPGLFPRLQCEAAIHRLSQDVAGFDNPELINDSPEGAPSRRLIVSLPAYGVLKADVGVAAAEKIGITALRQRCPHFPEWIGKLEALTPFQS